MQEFYSSRLLRKKFIFFSPLGFEIQKNLYTETLAFKLHSFRAFQRYLTDKNPTHGREQYQFLNVLSYQKENIDLKNCDGEKQTCKTRLLINIHEKTCEIQSTNVVPQLTETGMPVFIFVHGH